MMKSLHEKKAGFSLVEMLVAISVFTIVVSIAVGGFVRALRTQRQLAAIVATESNVSLALEQMAREIRTGSSFCVGPTDADCDLANGVFAFIDQFGKKIIYAYNSSVGSLERERDGAGLETITARNVFVTRFEIIIQNNDPTDGVAARITVSLGVRPAEASLKDFEAALQTTLSPRTNVSVDR